MFPAPVSVSCEHTKINRMKTPTTPDLCHSHRARLSNGKLIGRFGEGGDVTYVGHCGSYHLREFNTQPSERCQPVNATFVGSIVRTSYDPGRSC